MVTFSVNSSRKDIKMNLGFIRSSEKSGNVGEANDIRRQWLSTLYLNICNNKAEQDTDVTAYAVACNKRAMLNIANSEVPIISSDDLDEGVKGMCEDSLGYDEERFKTIEDYAKFITDLHEFINFADFVEIEDDIDLVQTMLSALDGNKIAVKAIQTLIAKYERLKELLYSIMSVEGWSKSIQTVASLA